MPQVIKLQVPGGQATAAPPVGPALGQAGVNIGDFVRRFNEQTKALNGTLVPVIVTVNDDRSFRFIVKEPPAAVLLKQAAGIAQGAAKPRTEVVGTITDAALTDVARRKMPDLNAKDLEGAKRIIAGTARSMGLKVEG